MKYFFPFFIIFLFANCSSTKYHISKAPEKQLTSFEIAQQLNFENQTKKAIYLYTKSFYDENNSNAALELARVYRYKINDYTKMIKWYENAHKMNNDYAMYELANFFYIKGEYDKALTYYEKSKLYNSTRLAVTFTKIKLYTLVYIKYHVLKDYKNTINHMKKTNVKINLYKLQNVYEHIPRTNYKKYDYKEKKYLITAFIDKHNLISFDEINNYKKLNTKESNYELARFYRYVFFDYKTAIDYYKKSHTLAHRNAAYELAELYNRHFYDIKNAIYWYKESNKIGNTNAAFALAMFYDFKLKAFDNASNWYKIAFKNGHKAAAINNSLIYKDKIKDVQKHLIWNGNKL